MAYVTSFEDLIYGEDNQSPIRKTLERVIEQAKDEEQRLRIEVRSKQDGVPSSRQEHMFVISPDQATTDGIMRVLVERLTESPGEGFFGQLRINFSQAGASNERYGSFTRQLKRPVHMPTPGFRPPGRGSQGFEGGDEEGDEYAEEGEEYDPMVANHLRGMAQTSNGFSNQAAPIGVVDQHQAQQWLETSMGFTFRAMAQQQAMFERTIRMLESFSLRFGLPHPVEQGIIEQKGGTGSSGGDGMGMLPMLIKAAAHLANAGTPEEAVQRAGSMAQGNPPPPSAARHAAIQGAGNLVRQLPRHAPPPNYDPPGGGGFDPNDDDDDDGAYFGPEGGDDEIEDDGQMPDLTNMSAAEMKNTVIEWIRKDPSRKAEVMGMLPDLQSELM